MTAEVAIANKMAVALAADSAATSSSNKIYSSQKLFPLLEQHHAVGVMIFQNSEFMGIPWETIISMYRQSHGNAPQPTIQCYVHDFLEYIGKEPFCTEAQESANILSIVGGALRLVRRRADELLTTTSDHGRSLSQALKEWLAQAVQEGLSPSMEGVSPAEISAHHKRALAKLTTETFGGYDLGEAERELIESVVQRSLVSKPLSFHFSGVVFAGFGEDEMFPSLVDVTTEGMVGGKLKHHTHEALDIGRNGDPAVVRAFAQGDMVQRFMEGVDPQFLAYLHETMGVAANRIVADASRAMGFDLGQQHRRLIRRLVEEQVEHYFQMAGLFRQQRFVQPIFANLRDQPRHELADLAEALVNLTALKTRVTDVVETVGGPIDVAVISKGEGFVWTRHQTVEL